MATIIDGKTLAAEIRTEVAAGVDQLRDAGVVPTLATVLIGDDPAAQTYVSLKQADCDEVGIETVDPTVAPTVRQDEATQVLTELNADSAVHGILLQLPLPDQLATRPLIEHIAPQKDVDGIHPENIGRLVAGRPRYKPCTPHGIQLLLASAEVQTGGRHAVVVGRSDIVGKPLANLLIQNAPGGNATTTVCHSRTTDLAAYTRQADILVVAIGQPEAIGPEHVTEGTTVIDVGINRIERDGTETLVGDVDFAAVHDQVHAITPVPGGVGPMTRALLLYNTVQAAARQRDVELELDIDTRLRCV